MGQVLEEEHQAAEEERRDNEEDQIFRVFEGEDEILVDQQGCLGEEAEEVIGLVILVGGVGRPGEM